MADEEPRDPKPDEGFDEEPDSVLTGGIGGPAFWMCVVLTGCVLAYLVLERCCFGA